MGGGEDGMHFGSCHAQGVGTFAEVAVVFGGVECDAPGILHAGQELLGEGEVTASPSVRAPGVAP